MLIQEMTSGTSQNGLELMKQKFHLKIREKNDREDNQLDKGNKNCLNKVREKPKQIKNSQWSFLAYIQLR